MVLFSRSSMSSLLVARAVAALAWAAALIVAVGDRVPGTGSSLPTAAAVLLTAYPLIDVVASLAEVASGRARHAIALRLNALVGAVATVALAATTFGADAGATLVAFGLWAAVSGALQLALALRRRHSEPGQLPLIVSGGLSTVAGLSFVAASSADAAHLANIGGYAALGAVLFLANAALRRRGYAAAISAVSSVRERRSSLR